MKWFYFGCAFASLIGNITASTISVSVRVIYPSTGKVSSIFLRGNGCGLNWDKGLHMSLTAGENMWESVIQCSSADTADLNKVLEVKVLVGDKDWMIGANHHIDIASSAGNITDTLYPWFYSRSGSLKQINRVFSSQLNNFRDLMVYLPPSFNENNLKPYKNIILMHDGQNLFDPKTSAFGTAWMAQNTADSSIVSGKSDEMIIVGIYNTPDRTNEYTYIYDASESSGGKGDVYLDWIESDVIPLIAKSNMRAEISRSSLGILGSSLGGLISCYAGWTRPNIYGKVGCMSSSFWWADQDYMNHMLPEHTAPTAPRAHFYMDSGTAGSLGGEAQCAVYTAQVYDYMISTGFGGAEEVEKYVDVGGQHNEASWGSRFYLPLEFLYPADTV